MFRDLDRISDLIFLKYFLAIIGCVEIHPAVENRRIPCSDEKQAKL